MTAKTLSIVVDTNLWVSMALGSKTVAQQMLRVIENPHVTIFTSAEQLEELTDTLDKPKLQKYLIQSRTQQLFELIWQEARLMHVVS